MKKRQISYAYVSLILMALIFVTILTCKFTSPNLFASADKTQLEEQHEAKIASYSNIEENYNGKLFVVMDRYSSGINKKQNKKFAKLGCINSIKDLTAISGDVESKKYLNKKEFRQILELDMTDSSRKDISKIVKKIEKIEGVLWVGVENAISFDTEVEEETTLANDSISYNSLPVATEGIRYQVQWGLHRTNGINVEGAWNYSTGSKSVKVGIIDSGIANHEELKPNLLPGWDFYNDNDITTDDVVGHGTHVAGIIGATGTTPHGVVGVCPNIKLVPLQVDNSNHMVSPSAVIKAITWSIDNDIDLINFSIGSYDEDEALKTAISNYQGLFVCSAGNDANNNSATPYYPSNYSQHQTFSNRLISVGAIAATGEIASFSNYGSNVSLYAPGVQIMSTYPKELDETGYKYKDGTSMATPFVTGVAALLYSKYLNNAHKISDSEIAAHIKNTILTNATKDGRYTYKFVFIRKDAKQYIGHWFNKQVVDAGGNPTNSEVQLVDVEISKEYTSAWSPVTAVHMCSYVNGMLSMPGGTTGLINIFEVDDKTMTINYDSYLADIDKYGLFTYEEFLEIQPIPRNVFEALGGQYMKIAIGKGLITTEELKNLIVKYSKLWE